MILSKRIFTMIAFLMTLALSQQSLAACFSIQGGGSFNVLDDRTVDIQTKFGKVFRLGVVLCWNLPWARRISFQSTFVCEGDNMIVYSSQQGPADRCWIQTIDRIH